MNKKFKWLLPIAAMALTCGLSAGMLTACGGSGASDSQTSSDSTAGGSASEHVHNYNVWKYDAEGHWKECDAGDGAKTEKEPHVFVAGECECGATEEEEEVKEYGSAEGIIVLNGGSGDFSGIDIDLGDDSVTIDLDEETGKFTLSDLEVGKDYELSITKEGYTTYGTVVNVAEKDEHVVIGGANGIRMDYIVFTNIINQWNDDYAQKGVDFQSHVNDAEPYVTSTADFFALQSRVTYGDVAITLKVKKGNIQPEEQGGAGAQGVLLMFGNEFVQLKIKRDGSIETSWDSLWGSYTNAIEEYMPGSNTWWLYNEDGSVKWNTGAGVALTDEENALYDAGEFTLTLVRTGEKILIYVNGEYTGNVVRVAADKAEMPAAVGIYGYDLVDATNNPGETGIFKYKIETDISGYLEDVTVNLPAAGEHGSVTADKSAYTIGDKVTLTVAPEEGYMLESLKINGADVTAFVEDGKYTFLAAFRTEYDVEVSFLDPNAKVNAEISVGNANFSAEGLTLTLTQGDLVKTAVVKDGKISVSDMNVGEWEVTAAFGGMTGVRLGKLILPESGVAALDLKNAIEENPGAFASFDLANGTYEVLPQSTKAQYGWFDMDDADGGYFAYRFGFDEESAAIMQAGGEASSNFSMIVGGVRLHLVVWAKNTANQQIVGIHVKGNGTDDGNLEQWVCDFGWNGDERTQAMLNGTGVLFAFGYNAETGDVEVYIGMDVMSMEKAMTISSFGIGAGKKIEKFGFGNWLNWGSSLLSHTYGNVRYGATLTEALGIDKVGVTIDENIENGTVTIDNATPAPGDVVTITVTPDEDYVLKALIVNGKSVSVDGEGKYSFEVLGEYTVTAEFIKAGVTIDENIENGTVTIDKPDATLGDEVVLTITPAAGYVLGKLVVDGQQVNLGESNTYTFTVSGEHIVTAEFAELVEVDLIVKGSKLGVQTLLPQGTQVSFKGTTYTYTVGADGRITGEAIPEGTYTVVVNGYLEQQISYDGALVEIVLGSDVFDLFKNWDGESHDFSHVNDEDGYITMTQGKTLNVVTKDSYEKAAASLLVKESNSTNSQHRQGIVLRFEDGKYVFITALTNGTNWFIQYNKDEWGCNGGVQNILDVTYDEWGGGTVYTLTDEEVSAVKADGLVLQAVVFEGNIYIYFGGKLCCTTKILGDYADDKVQIGYYCYDSAVGCRWYIDISEDLPALPVGDEEA